MQAYWDVFFLWIILKRTSTEAHVYMRRHQGKKVKHFDISNSFFKTNFHTAPFPIRSMGRMLEFTVKNFNKFSGLAQFF